MYVDVLICSLCSNVIIKLIIRDILCFVNNFIKLNILNFLVFFEVCV